MLPGYEDIRALTDREPDWWDVNGCPRYAPFHPRMLGVYDEYALLVRIECQQCRQSFLVGEGYTSYHLVRRDPDHPEASDRGWVPITFAERAAGYHYGDPPAHDCRGGGETMNCVDMEIVEAWQQDHARGRWLEPDRGWDRVPEIEAFDIRQDWDKPGYVEPPVPEYLFGGSSPNNAGEEVPSDLGSKMLAEFAAKGQTYAELDENDNVVIRGGDPGSPPV